MDVHNVIRVMKTSVVSLSGVVLDVCSDIPAWAGRELEDGNHKRGYFGIKTAERVIEFECRNKYDQHKWVQGISEMLIRRDSMSNAL